MSAYHAYPSFFGYPKNGNAIGCYVRFRTERFCARSYASGESDGVERRGMRSGTGFSAFEIIVVAARIRKVRINRARACEPARSTAINRT
jgi:hypothetical protein